MKKLEKSLKAVANQRRLSILKLLKENKEQSVSVIAFKIKLSIRSTSKHLAILFGADILDREQRNFQTFYRLLQNQEPSVKYIISIL